MDKKLTEASPVIEQVEEELAKAKKRHSFGAILKQAASVLTLTASLLILVVMIVLPVLRISGSAMTPTLTEGDIVVSFRGSTYDKGDLVILYIGSNMLVKRIIAGPNDWVDIDEHGNVTVNEEYIEEPYLTAKAFGDCNIELPFRVPGGQYFVMGDQRAISFDSRNAAVGAIPSKKIVGKVLYRIWPFSRFGVVEPEETKNTEE